jgi:hypothetical protein
MDPLSIAAAIIGIIGTSFSIGRGLLSLHQSYRLAPAQVIQFRDEIDHFRTVWELVDARIESWSPRVGQDLFRTLMNARYGASQQLHHMQLALERFERRDAQLFETECKENNHMFQRDRKKNTPIFVKTKVDLAYREKIKRWKAFMDSDQIKPRVE